MNGLWVNGMRRKIAEKIQLFPEVLDITFQIELITLILSALRLCSQRCSAEQSSSITSESDSDISSAEQASTWRIALTWQSEKGRLAGSQADREPDGRYRARSLPQSRLICEILSGSFGSLAVSPAMWQFRIFSLPIAYVRNCQTATHLFQPR